MDRPYDGWFIVKNHEKSINVAIYYYSLIVYYSEKSKYGTPNLWMI